MSVLDENVSKIEQVLTIMNDESQMLEEKGRAEKIIWEGGAGIDKKLLMASLIFCVKPKLVYEIGINIAGMAVVMCRWGAREGARYVGFEIAHRRKPVIDLLHEWYPSVAEIVWGNSAVTVPQRFDMTGERPDIIFVDGLHTQQGASVDIKNSIECIKPGGIMMIDDIISYNTVHKAFLEHFKEEDALWFRESNVALVQVRK